MINTVEELEELPPDTVIRDAEGIVYEVGSTPLFWANDRSYSASQVYLPAVRLVPEPEPLDIDQIATRYLVTNFGCGCVDCYETAREQVVEVLTAAGFTMTHPRTERESWEPPFWNGDYDDQYVRGCSNCDGGGCGDCVIA